jgi:transcriptional regulator GlxA family with amidase domain
MQLLYDIIATLAERQSQNEPGFLLRKRLEPALEVIRMNMANSSLSVEEAAKTLRLTRTHFERLFMKAYGMTPLKFIKNMRIEHAKDLLRGAFYNISEIAYMSGFGDLYYFSKVFKNETGMPPSDYRKNG